ncbi:MAG: DNA starvation/stationary phase protection protein Dps [Verrucomicrobia bacterium]|nr:DNA starvation/stationary phase protection protein Dps [Verrucomicrobiota bacterium]
MNAIANFPTNIDLPPQMRERIIELLNAQLADTADLYSQTKQAHWNVKGPHFMQLHLLFDQLAEELFPWIDTIAERATALGGMAAGTVRMAGSTSRLPEWPLHVVEGMASVEELVERYAELAASTREAIKSAMDLGDADTADLFTNQSRGLDKSLWFLQAHLQGSD